jgi:hypothetical protein
VTILAVLYLACFQLCALPSVVRIRRRGRSGDLSVWREWLLIIGVSVQLVVMLHAGVPWQVWISPVLSFTSVSVLLGHIYWYRRESDQFVSVKGG